MASAEALGPGVGTTGPVRVAAWLFGAIDRQRGHLFNWTPVAFGTGIGFWFALPVEPGHLAYVGLGALAILLLPVALRGPERIRPVAAAVILAFLGALTIGYRAHSLAAPVLDFRYYGAIEGRVIEIDRSLSDKPRLTLDRVVLERMAPHDTPARVRVSLHGRAEEDVVEAGTTVILTGHLSGPQGPAEPGGFDFRRMAWFEQLGAVGYTRSPVLELEAADPGITGLFIARLRQNISEGVRAAIPGEEGGFVAAILTGDRSGISRETVDHLRNSSLAHLLSISGLHMALLSGFVFMVFRGGLALIPALALRLPTKKIAAGIALVAAAFYLALSGGNTPTMRAFVMTAMVLCAVLLDRRALTLRAVALAAMVILVLQPEALVQPGFQMSFSATAALIVAFNTFSRRPGAPRRLPRWAAPVVTLFLSSLVAGVATAPFAAAHFNRIADYSLLANILSVPLMGAVIMPAAVIAAVLWPLGLAAPAFWVMQKGTAWILGVAAWVSTLPGAVSYVPAAPPSFLPVFTIGALILLLWRGWGMLAGLAPMAAACLIWSAQERPPVLIADTGGIVGVLTGDGRAVTKASGNGFIARSWLEDDGDSGTQEAAFERAGFTGTEGALAAVLGDTEIVVISGRGWRDKLADACAPGRILVVANETEPPAGGCRVLDSRALETTGSLAGWITEDGRLDLVSAKELAGERLWTGGARED